MSIIYKCKKCEHTTSHFNDMKKHINKKKSCAKNINAFTYSDDQLLVYTFVPYINNIQNLDENNIEYLHNSKILCGNKSKLFEVLEDIKKQKLKKCKYCNEEFDKIIDLRKHIIVNCYYHHFIKNNILIDNSERSVHSNSTDIKEATLDNSNNLINNTNSNNISILNNITDNSTSITNNITNNNNIKIYLNNPVPFESDWDISEISQDTKTKLIVSQMMYTKFLEEILKNDKNLNVIIDKDNDSGIVYKNDIDKYTKMKSNDIVENTMEKLYRQLHNFNKDEKEALPDVIDYSKEMIKYKYTQYEKNPTLKKSVNKLLFDIYDNRRDKALKIANNIIKDESDNKIEFY